MTTATDNPAQKPEVATPDEAGTAPGDRRFRPDVEGLRAVAVLLVVIYHAGIPGIHGGFVGVDVFFVISGFVITGLLLRERSSSGRTSLLDFYARRVRRILPAATLVIVTTVVATYVVLGVVYGDPTSIAARWTAVFLANFHFAAIGTNYLTAKQPPSPLQNFWSLAVEEQFYLVYPAVFLAVASLKSGVSLRVRLIAALVPIILVSLILSAVQTATNPTAAFFSPFTRAWELALGALVAAATPALLRLPRSLACAMTWIGLAAIGLAAVSFTSSTQYPGTLVAVPVIGSALVIAGGMPVPSGGAEAVLRLGAFQWMGRRSYALYLWHWPILILAAEGVGKASLPFHQNLGWLGLAVVAAMITHTLVENPVRHARSLLGRRWRSLVLGVALMAISLIVATVALDLHAVHGAPPQRITTTTKPLSPTTLAQLVAAAPTITSLPADLTPSLAAVHNDWGGPGAPCFPTDNQSSIPPCVFGNPNGTRTLVLYGDSHAAMWFDAIDLIAYASGWKVVVLAKGYCPAVDLPFQNAPDVGPPSNRFVQCDQWHRFSLARMRSVHPDLVIVTQEVDLGPGGRTYPAAVWRTATATMIRTLPVLADRVVVLGNIPWHARGGPQCLSLHPTDVQQCSGPNSSFFVQHHLAEQRAALETGARYVDTVPWFCSATCTNVIGHFQPYFDPFHVTNSYAVALAPILADALDLGSLPTNTSPSAPRAAPG